MARLTNTAFYYFFDPEDYLIDKSFIVDSTEEAIIKDMATDGVGNLFLLGHFKGDIVVNQRINPSSGGTDIFLIKLSPQRTFESLNTYVARTMTLPPRSLLLTIR